MKGGAAVSDRRIVSPAYEGQVRAIASKSELHRALVAASLCDVATELCFRGVSEDILATVSCLSSFGAEILPTPTGYRVSRGETRSIARAGIDKLDICLFSLGSQPESVKHQGCRGCFRVNQIFCTAKTCDLNQNSIVFFTHLYAF